MMISDKFQICVKNYEILIIYLSRAPNEDKMLRDEVEKYCRDLVIINFFELASKSKNVPLIRRNGEAKVVGARRARKKICEI